MCIRDSHKTKTVAQALGRLEADRKVLIVDVPAPKGADGAAPEFVLERKLALATRNIEGVKAVPTRDVTVYDLLNHRKVVLTEAAARKLSEALSK